MVGREYGTAAAAVVLYGSLAVYCEAYILYHLSVVELCREETLYPPCSEVVEHLGRERIKGDGTNETYLVAISTVIRQIRAAEPNATIM